MWLDMKRTISAIVIGVSALSAQLTSADEGTIHFTGLVQDQSCNLSVDGSGSGEGTIVLPSVPLSELAVTGIETGETSFVIILTECMPGLKVRPFFEANNVYPPSGALGNTTTPSDGGAKNVNIAIINSQGTRLDLNSNLITDNPFETIDSAGEAEFEYKASYLAIGTATAGIITTALVYNLTYQ